MELREAYEKYKKFKVPSFSVICEKASNYSKTCLLIISILLLFSIYLMQQIPHWQVAQFGINNSTEIAQLENSYRATLAQVLGGSAVAIGIYFAWRNIKVAQEGQITERFTRAIDQLGNPNLEIKLGGIYALERISKESKEDYWPIMEILTAYVRKNSSEDKSRCASFSTVFPLSMDTQNCEIAKKELLDMNKLSDIQAALTVLGRRKYTYNNGESEKLDLCMTNLGMANLAMTHFEGANFSMAHLEGTNLTQAHLEEANLSKTHLNNLTVLTLAHLEGSNLMEANLTGTCLVKANLEGANLIKANLRGANLAGSYLKGADLIDVNLEGANLIDANLTGARLVDANVQKANFSGANLEGATLRAIFKGAKFIDASFGGANLEGAILEGANLTGANLEKANLRSADLKKSHLRKANLGGACLKKANLEGANLKGANLRGVSLQDAHLKEAINLTIDQLYTVKTLYNAKLDKELLISLKEEHPALFEKPNQDEP